MDVQLRRNLGSGFRAEVLDCFCCLWVSAPRAYFNDVAEPPVTTYVDDPEKEGDTNVMLRAEEGAIAGRHPRT